MIDEKENAGTGANSPAKPEAVQEQPELSSETPELTDDNSASDEHVIESALNESADDVQVESSEPTEQSQDSATDQSAETPLAADLTTPSDSTESSQAQEAATLEEETDPQDQPISQENNAQEATGKEELKSPEVKESGTDASASSPSDDSTEDDEDDEDDKHEDHDELHEEDHDDAVDYSQLSKEELEAAIAQLAKDEFGYKKGKKLFAIKDAYDELFSAEKDDALQRFIADGGSEDDFDYKLDDTSIKFEEYYKMIRQKRKQNARELEKQKEDNLAKKTALLERLREFVDNDENTESIGEVRKMQEEWKSIGAVPHNQNRTLWANYNALMDRFYDHRSIYFELKELDRKKNLEAKEALCEQAEELAQLENINEAIKKLNELHEEYKHIGPIPKEVQEETWQRFKAASDMVYTKRKEFFSNLKETFEENYHKKLELAQLAEELNTFTTESIAEWNGKTKEVLALQKQWEAIGSMPKDKAKEVNRTFWAGFKSFFKHKSEFFKELDSQREVNLEKKQALVDKANELKTSDDWVNTANAMKDLQKKWKDIGPVPEKKRDSIYKAFKKACDEFFNRRREHSKGLESDYVQNLAKKETICEKLEALAGIDDLDPEQVYELQDEFNAIGFVPKKAIKSIQNRYQSALNAIVKQVKNFEQDELDELRSLISINKIKSGPHGDQKLHRKEQALKRKIQNLEGDISTWKNNLGFFANSKNANQLLSDFEDKIKKAEEELIGLKEELKLITYAGDS